MRLGHVTLGQRFRLIHGGCIYERVSTSFEISRRLWPGRSPMGEVLIYELETHRLKVADRHEDVEVVDDAKTLEEADEEVDD